MKYRVSQLPNTGHANRFKVQDPAGKHLTEFLISKDLISIWRNPSPLQLKEVMVAYVKKNGWVKEPVSLDTANSPRALNAFVASLSGTKRGIPQRGDKPHAGSPCA